jgi:hypothetical protein
MVATGGLAAITGIAMDDGASPVIGIVSGTALGTLGLIAGGVQGTQNVSVSGVAPRRQPRVRVWAAPLRDKPGLQVGGTW